MFNDEPLVSICCLTYNHESFIRRAFDSFLMQKVDFEYEILIHDDASTDSTQEIIKEYCNLYPNLFKPILQTVNQHSNNVPISVQFQFPRVKGKYIAFCEGDDYWVDPYKLSKQVNFLETNKEYIGTTHQCLIVDENETPIARYSPTFLFVTKKSKIFTQKDAESFLLPGQTGTLVFRSNAITNFSISEWTSGFMDFSLLAFLSLQGDIYVFPDIMSAYRSVIIGGSSYSYRYNNKTNMKTYYLRKEIERKASVVFNKKFNYKSIDKKYTLDAIVNYIKTQSLDELEIIIELLKVQNIKLSFIIYFPLLVLRLQNKIKYYCLNKIFLCKFNFYK